MDLNYENCMIMKFSLLSTTVSTQDVTRVLLEFQINKRFCFFHFLLNYKKDWGPFGSRFLEAKI